MYFEVRPVYVETLVKLVLHVRVAGDGGLLSDETFSWTLFAGILFFAAVAMGISFVTQREKSEE